MKPAIYMEPALYHPLHEASTHNVGDEVEGDDDVDHEEDGTGIATIVGLHHHIGITAQENTFCKQNPVKQQRIRKAKATHTTQIGPRSIANINSLNDSGWEVDCLACLAVFFFLSHNL